MFCEIADFFFAILLCWQTTSNIPHPLHCVHANECRWLTIIVREAHVEMGLLDLLDEDILLVKEEYNGGGGEVTVIADAVEQMQTLMHPVLGRRWKMEEKAH